MSRTLEERFLLKVKKTKSCWIWTASFYYSVKGSNRYGHMFKDGKVRPSHRISYELFVGSIPEGFDIDHLCRNTLCVNPAHLQAVPHRVNVIDRGIGPFADRARQTHCKYGHEFTAENTYIHKSRGVRVCKQCHRDRVNEDGKRKRKTETPEERDRRLAYHRELRKTEEYKTRFNAYRRARRAAKKSTV